MSNSANERSGRQQSWCDFGVAMFLMTVIPVMTVVYLALNDLLHPTVGLSLRGALVAAPACALGLLGITILSRYVRGSARLHARLDCLTSDIPRPAGYLNTGRGAWQLDAVAEAVIREYRKKILVSQAEKAAIERRLLEITGKYTVPRGAR